MHRPYTRMTLSASARCAACTVRIAFAMRIGAGHALVRSTHWCRARIGAGHKLVQSTQRRRAQIGAGHALVQSTQWRRAQIGAEHALARGTHWCGAHIGARHTLVRGTHWCEARIGAKHKLVRSTHWRGARIGAGHTLVRSTQWCRTHIGATLRIENAPCFACIVHIAFSQYVYTRWSLQIPSAYQSEFPSPIRAHPRARYSTARVSRYTAPRLLAMNGACLPMPPWSRSVVATMRPLPRVHSSM